MNQNIVDIVVPVFNGATTITEAIESLQRQTFTNFRIIVVDDGSTDQTPEVLAALRARDSRITVVTQPNGGIADHVCARRNSLEGRMPTTFPIHPVWRWSSTISEVTRTVQQCLAPRSTSTNKVDTLERFRLFRSPIVRILAGRRRESPI